MFKSISVASALLIVFQSFNFATSAGGSSDNEQTHSGPKRKNPVPEDRSSPSRKAARLDLSIDSSESSDKSSTSYFLSVPITAETQFKDWVNQTFSKKRGTSSATDPQASEDSDEETPFQLIQETHVQQILMRGFEDFQKSLQTGDQNLRAQGLRWLSSVIEPFGTLGLWNVCQAALHIYHKIHTQYASRTRLHFLKRHDFKREEKVHNHVNETILSLLRRSHMLFAEEHFQEHKCDPKHEYREYDRDFNYDNEEHEPTGCSFSQWLDSYTELADLSGEKFDLILRFLNVINFKEALPSEDNYTTTPLWDIGKELKSVPIKNFRIRVTFLERAFREGALSHLSPYQRRSVFAHFLRVSSNQTKLLLDHADSFFPRKLGAAEEPIEEDEDEKDPEHYEVYIKTIGHLAPLSSERIQASAAKLLETIRDLGLNSLESDLQQKLALMILESPGTVPYEKMGDLLKNESEHAQALACFQRALAEKENDPKAVSLRLSILKCLIKLNHTQEARRVLDEISSTELSQETFHRLQNSRLEIFVQEENWNEAIAIAKHIETRYQSTSTSIPQNVLCYLGVAYFKLGSQDQALPYLTKFLASPRGFDPSWAVKAYQITAQLVREKNDYEQLIAITQKAAFGSTIFGRTYHAFSSSCMAHAYANIAWAQEGLNQPDQALTSYKEARQCIQKISEEPEEPEEPQVLLPDITMIEAKISELEEKQVSK